MIKQNKAVKYINQKKFLFRFLKEEGIYASYIKYIKNPSCYNAYQRENVNWSFDKCAKKFGIRDIISTLIVWRNTREGFDFWCNKCQKFRHLFDEKFLKKQVNISLD